MKKSCAWCREQNGSSERSFSPVMTITQQHRFCYMLHSTVLTFIHYNHPILRPFHLSLNNGCNRVIIMHLILLGFNCSYNVLDQSGSLHTFSNLKHQRMARCKNQPQLLECNQLVIHHWELCYRAWIHVTLHRMYFPRNKYTHWTHTHTHTYAYTQAHVFVCMCVCVRMLGLLSVFLTKSSLEIHIIK